MYTNGHRKMDVGIITFANELNFGAALQAYALQRYLKDINLESEFVHLDLSAFRNMKMGIRYYLISLALKIIYLRKAHNFMKFHKAEFRQSERFKSYTDLLKRHVYYDAVICGSDQIWNPNITFGLQPYYFGHGISSRTCLAYAASCGKADTIQNELDTFKKLAGNCDRISVRERTTCDFLNDNGVACACVVDPTLLVHQETWRAVAEKSRIKKQVGNTRYIFVYDLERTEVFEKLVRDISSQTGLPVVSLRKWYHYANDRFRFPAAGPYDFLYLLMNAKIVISNSYHALLFSSIFDKDIYVVRHSRYDERMVDYLALFNKSFDRNNCAHVDFSSADRTKLNNAVEASRTFIEESLKADYGKA